jgi:F-type H+-transporting ATPase subunit alpha
MRSVAGTLKLDLAQYREKAAFSQFASDLDKVTRDMLDRGIRLVEILKQGQYVPLPAEKQVVIIYAGTRGFLDGFEVGRLGAYEMGLYSFLESTHPEILETIRTKKTLDNDLEASLKVALDEFGKAFGKGAG